MESFSCKVFVVAILLILELLTSASAQSSASSTDWETLRPEGEEFSVLMPKGSTFESGKQPYHRMEVNTRLYLSQAQNGPVFAVVSLSGIKSNPEMYSEMQRVNSYVDAFKQLFPAKIRGKATPVKLTLAGEKTLYGNAGREYRMTVGDLSGTVHAFATRRRFYALVYLNSKKDESIQDQFLSSFVLPEKIVQPPAAVAAKTSPEATDPAQPSNQPTPAKEAGATTAANAASATNDPKSDEPDPSGTQPRKLRTVSGGVLNGRAISLPKPAYPADAVAAGASGTVTVQVTIDEAGMVIEAKAISGHQLLRPAAVSAALQARFSPTMLMGEPVKVSGSITYNFVHP